MNDSETNRDCLSAAKYLNQAHFQFRTLEEARSVADFLASACPNPRLAIMGITEILINAIEHGNLAINYDEKSELQHHNWAVEIEHRLTLPENINKYVHVHFLRTEKELRIRVIDEGAGFDWKKYQTLSKKRALDSHGRGIVMAKNLFSRVEFLSRGNEVLCVIPL
jgi:anti-sigma regulatory factor (Ser/Thr protein kinase)